MSVKYAIRGVSVSQSKAKRVSIVCLVRSASGNNHLQANASRRIRGQAIAGHGIERRIRTVDASDLGFIAVLRLDRPTTPFTGPRRTTFHFKTARPAAPCATDCSPFILVCSRRKFQRLLSIRHHERSCLEALFPVETMTQTIEIVGWYTRRQPREQHLEEQEQRRSTYRYQAFHHLQLLILLLGESPVRLEGAYSSDYESNPESSSRMAPSIRIGEH